MKTGVASILVALALAGCSLEQMAVKQTSAILRKGSAAMEQENDLMLARAAAPASLKTVEAFLLVSPKNPDLLYLTTKGYCEYALGFVEADLDEALDRGDTPAADRITRHATNLYIRCMNYALRMLGGNWHAVVTGSDMVAFDKKLKKAGKGDVTGLFFVGLGLASSININRDNYELLTHLPKVEKIMKRIVELKPTHYNGGAHLALGSLYGSQGEAAGGKPGESLKHFKAAMAMTKGRFLLHKVLFAKVYAVTKGNRALFEKTLIEVLRAPNDIWPEFRLANEIAKQRARRLWNLRDELF